MTIEISDVTLRWIAVTPGIIVLLFCIGWLGNKIEEKWNINIEEILTICLFGLIVILVAYLLISGVIWGVRGLLNI